MLILIVGITGNLGRLVCAAALDAGHTVRGFGRNPSKLPDDLASRLESFVTSTSHDDITAIDKACSGGVKAIVNAWFADPMLQLDGQLLLLRAAERAGIKRFHAATWNLDWTKCQLGDLTSYDGMKSFERQAFLTSSIRPCHVFVGVFAKTLFAFPGAGALEADNAMWLRGEGQKRTLRVPGKESWRMNWTPEEDAAAFSVALITSDYGEKGGFYRFCSDTFSTRDLKEAWEEVRPGGEVSHETPIALDDIKKLMVDTKAAAQAAGPDVYRAQYFRIAGLEYGYYMPSEKLMFEPVDADKFPNVKRTSLREYIRDNAWI